jgi:hypothetical protein
MLLYCCTYLAHYCLVIGDGNWQSLASWLIVYLSWNGTRRSHLGYVSIIHRDCVAGAI